MDGTKAQSMNTVGGCATARLLLAFRRHHVKPLPASHRLPWPFCYLAHTAPRVTLDIGIAMGRYPRFDKSRHHLIELNKITLIYDPCNRRLLIFHLERCSIRGHESRVSPAQPLSSNSSQGYQVAFGRHGCRYGDMGNGTAGYALVCRLIDRPT